MLLKYLLIICVAILVHSLKDIRNTYDLKTQVEQSNWSFLKVYSKDCGYCKQIQPVCIELEKENKNITFLEIVGTEQKEFSLNFKISIYPTLFLFHKHLDLPVVHHGARDKQNLQGWIQYVTSFELPKVSELKENPDVLYKGPRGKQYDLVKLLALRNIHTVYAWEQTDDSSFVSVDGVNYTKFTSNLELEILKAKAKFSNFSESTWYNIHVKKMKGILFINHKSTQEFNKIFDVEAKRNPDIVFANIDPKDANYFDVLDYLSADKEQAVFAILPARSGFYKMSEFLTSQNLEKFIRGVKEENLIPHKKTQKSDNPYILTRQNEHLVAELPKDVLLFLYDDRKPYTQKLMQLANYIIAYLRSNPNIHVFICNPLKNDLTLEVPVDPLPSVIFFKHNMKEHHIYFPHNQINPDSVLEFIQENTTFDWVEPEEYGIDENQDQKEKAKQTGDGEL